MVSSVSWTEAVGVEEPSVGENTEMAFRSGLVQAVMASSELRAARKLWHVPETVEGINGLEEAVVAVDVELVDDVALEALEGAAEEPLAVPDAVAEPL